MPPTRKLYAINPLDKANPTRPIALITGASSGLGAAFATVFLEAGWEVHGTHRRPDPPEAPTGTHWHHIDLSDGPALEKWIQTHRTLLDRVDLLINNAGFGLIGPLEVLPPRAVSQQIQVMLSAPIRLCSAVLPAMKGRNHGTIVNVSSLAAELPLPYAAAYNAAKAGLSALSTSLQSESHGTKVRVIDFRPGDVRTAFNKNAHKSLLGDKNAEITWAAMEKNLRHAPTASACALYVRSLVTNRRQVIARWGDFFQARLAPWGVRLLPPRLLAWAIRRYYGLRG